MNHYVCKGECKGVSEKPGVCTDDSCSRKGQDLEVCDCRDGKHLPENHEPRENT